MRTVWVLLLVLCAGARAAEACSCLPAGRPCEATWRAAAVFSGKVVSITPAPPLQLDREYSIRGRLVTFEVTEGFRGVSGTTMQVRTGQDDADCGYPFVIGQTYVVYTHQYRNGDHNTGICTRTRPIGGGGADIAYLREFNRQPSFIGRVFADVTFIEETVDGDRGSPRPYAGVRIVLTGSDGVERSGVSSQTGTAEIAAPAGSHDVSVTVSPGLYASVYPARVEVRDVRGCGEIDVVVRYDGRVSGRVVDSEGKPVPHLGVSLGDPKAPAWLSFWARFDARTDANGDYEFVHIPPGTFLLGVTTERDSEQKRFITPPAFYPGVSSTAQAQPFAVDASGRTRLEDFVLPTGLRYASLSGIVVDADDRPAPGARVYFKAGTRDQRTVGQTVVADADGWFSVALVEGMSYTISASRSVANASSQSEQITVSARMAAVTLKLRPLR